ncbi:BQ2448_6354 [Microbotryum intermedium]|uniref:Holocytochrome c-type synthase n=1 Tax=Microbotryum intermedium TaxID=269621 RepID=A0A238FPV9_9BASI|nr:BQ2448_6354 [Microbotryum intermedium]
MWPFTTSTSTNASSSTSSSSSSTRIPEAACPVDHSTRSTWVNEAQQQAQATPSRPPPPQAPVTPNHQLSTEREVSSIPRWLPPSTSTSTSQASSSSDSAVPPSACPAQSVSISNPTTTATDETSSSKQGENWVYPSPSSFYSALQRKSQPANPSDMPIVVPIHNAVNEKVWQDVLEWERLALGKGKDDKVGSKLVSFVGKPNELSPRARWKSLIGSVRSIVEPMRIHPREIADRYTLTSHSYTPPFDRHDWIVDRPLPATTENPQPGSVRVRYVIDFYSGRGASLLQPQGGSATSRTDVFTRPSLAFFIDCRPALDGWEGVRMRVDKVREEWFGSSRGGPGPPPRRG